MNVDQASLFAIVLGVSGGLGILAVLIFLVFELRRGRETQEIDAAAPLAAPASTPADRPGVDPARWIAALARRAQPASAASDAHEVLRVARDNLTGRLIVELAGQRFARVDDIPAETLRPAFLTTLRDLERFAGRVTPTLEEEIAPASPVGPALAAIPPAAPPVLPMPEVTPPPAASSPVGAVRPAASPPIQTAAAAELPPLPKPSMNPFRQMRVLREMEKRPTVPLKSIPEIIDEYLQQKLLGTPHIWRGVRVKAGPKDTVLFEADGVAYDTVEAVPDAEVRLIIQSAIAEWDSKR